MFVVTVDFEVEVTQFSDFLRKLRENAVTSLTQEPGCKQFDVCVDAARQGHVFLYEVYVDREAFDAHLASAQFRKFDEEVRAMVVSKHVRRLQRVEPA